MNNLVSIIIPCYNAERFIADAIESALAQTYQPIEVIVIDDGSTDRSLDVIRTFGDRIHYETGPNCGGCAARNRGIDAANGQLIQFLDADDLLKPHKLEAQIPVVLMNPNELVYCDYDETNIEDGRWIRTHSAEIEIDPVIFVLRNLRLNTTAPIHWTAKLRAHGGFRRDLLGAQEFNLHLRLAADGVSFYHLRQSLYVLRHREGSVSSNFPRTIGEHLKFVPHVADQLKAKGQLSDDRAKAFAQRLAWNARGCLRHGAKALAANFFEEARRIHPSGGLTGVYSPSTLMLRRFLGPSLTEWLVSIKRVLAVRAAGFARRH